MMIQWEPRTRAEEWAEYEDQRRFNTFMSALKRTLITMACIAAAYLYFFVAD